MTLSAASRSSDQSPLPGTGPDYPGTRRIFEPDHVAFRMSVRSFVEREILPHYPDAVEQRRIPRALWLAMGRQGLLGLAVPEAHGGSGSTDFRYSAILTEELSRVSAAVASAFSIQYDIVSPYLTELTTPEQRARLLPDFCSGALITAIAMTEPSGGSDLAHLRTTARETSEGWILNGSKTFITNGIGADLVIVAARTGPDQGSRGISLFAVPTDRPGFRRGRKLDKVGQPEADTAELFFDDTPVFPTDLIGEIGDGFAAMMKRLPQERISNAISNLAHAWPILAETVAYAQERTAFGQPIGHFQHLKFQMAEMRTALDVAQAFIDECILRHTEGGLTAAEAAKAKWWSARVQNEVIDGCVQVFGGYGYMREYRVAQAWMDARVTRIWAGTNEIMKEIIGRDMGL